MRLRLPTLLVLAALGPSWSLAAETSAPTDAPTRARDEAAALKTEFEFGRFRRVLERAEARIDRGGLSDADLTILHRYAALSAFNLNLKEQADRHFGALLRLDPDFALDPFSVPPPAIAAMDRLRERMHAELEQVREDRRLLAERQRQEAEERALSLRESELQRRQLDDLTRRTLQKVEHHSYLTNFIPFGLGQFEEGRTGWGVGFAVSEGLLAGASVVAFWVYQLAILNHDQLYTFPDRLAPNQIRVEGVPLSRTSEGRFWRGVKTYSGVGFYAVYAAGVADAILHYQDQTVTTVVQDAPNAPAAPRTRPPRAGLFLVPGGAGVGVSLQF